MGPVRQAAYDAAKAAEDAVTTTSDTAKKSMLQLTAKGLTLIGKLCEVADEVLDGGNVELYALGKKIGELKFNISEKGE
jgi:hypothetical protein